MGSAPASSWFFEMDQVIRMTEAQKRKAYRLIRKDCCNYIDGYCLLLDCPCPQLITRSLICKWFRNAVLPGDVPLYVDLTGDNGKTKLCTLCGKPFYPRSNRARFCEPCAREVRLRQQRDYMRKKRAVC